MNKILILCSHPNLSNSKANKALLESVQDIDGVNIMHIDETAFNVESYQKAFQEANIIIFQFPLYWGGAPSLLKKWSDEIFIHLIANEGALHKRLMIATTAGAPLSSFTSKGSNLYPIETLVTPYELQANYSGMGWIPPFAIYDIENENLQTQSIREGKEKYRALIQKLIQE